MNETGLPLPGLAKRISDNLSESASDIVERQSKTFMGVSRELGLGAAFGFTFVAIFVTGALLFFWKVVLPDRDQARENQKADNETKLSLAKAFDSLAGDVAEQKQNTVALGTEIKLLRTENKAASTTHHEGQQAQWRVLSDMRDELRAWNGKPPLPRTTATAATAATADDERPREKKPERPESPPMPQSGPSPDALPGSEKP